MNKKDFSKIAEILNKNLANDKEQEQHIKEEMTKDFIKIAGLTPYKEVLN